MRNLLIIIQAAVLMAFAVYGAMGSSAGQGDCPLPEAQAVNHCQN